MRGKSGHITGPGGEVTFRLPGVRSVHIDGKKVEPVEKGGGFIRIDVPAGRHAIALNSVPIAVDPTQE